MAGQTIVRVLWDSVERVTALSVRIDVDGHTAQVRQMMQRAASRPLRLQVRRLSHIRLSWRRGRGIAGKR